MHGQQACTSATSCSQENKEFELFKFDLEPEVQVAVGALQLAGGTDQDRTLALQQWRGVPASVKQRAVEFDLKGREWPPAALDAAAAFLTAVAPEGTSGPDVPFSRL